MGSQQVVASLKDKGHPMHKGRCHPGNHRVLAISHWLAPASLLAQLMKVGTFLLSTLARAL